jgi:hypothetical protein
MNEFYAHHITELSKKMKHFKILQTQDIRALKEVGPELEKLRIKASKILLTFRRLKRFEISF